MIHVFRRQIACAPHHNNVKKKKSVFHFYDSSQTVRQFHVSLTEVKSVHSQLEYALLGLIDRVAETLSSTPDHTECK